MPDDILDIGVRNLWLKQIAHAVNEYGAWAWPVEGFREFFRNKAKVKALLIRVVLDPAA
jgi:hypothetical protein